MFVKKKLLGEARGMFFFVKNNPKSLEESEVKV